MKTSKMNRGIFKNDSDLPVESDKKSNKRAAKLIMTSRNVKLEGINSNQVRKILLSSKKCNPR